MKQVRKTFAAMVTLAALTISVQLMIEQSSAATADAAQSLLTDAEAKEVGAVVNSMILAGFPDGDQAVVYVGTIRVSATFDPGKEHHPLPSLASRTQMTHGASADMR